MQHDVLIHRIQNWPYLMIVSDRNSLISLPKLRNTTKINHPSSSPLSPNSMGRAVSGFNVDGKATFFRAGLSRRPQVQPHHHVSSLGRYKYNSNRPNSVIIILRCCSKEEIHKKNSQYWADIESDIELHLKKSIQIRHPVDMFEPMHYLTFAAPETRAPALCIASCELVGGDRDQAMAAAAAIHLVHAAAYVHENLPLKTTSSSGRRSRPPVKHKFSPNIELLTGDALLPFGFELLARSMKYSPENKADQILRVIVEISKASGSQGIIYGQ